MPARTHTHAHACTRARARTHLNELALLEHAEVLEHLRDGARHRGLARAGRAEEEHVEVVLGDEAELPALLVDGDFLVPKNGGPSCA